jgi:plastocyanin
MRRLVPILAVLSATAVAGCGSTGEQSTTGGTTTGATPAQNRSTPEGPRAGQKRVLMASLKFHPSTTHARVGETVRWVNDDPVAHTVTATQGASFDSGTVDVGGHYSQKLGRAGTIAYVCTIHPGMTGRIVVTG